MRLLTFSSLYPSSARPQHGLFVAARLRELRARHGFEAQVLAPVPWFPLRGERFGEYGRWARTPHEEVWQGQPVAHPRYLMIPRIGMRWQPDALARAAIRWVERSGCEFDLIDAHYFYPDGVAAAALSRHFGKPLLITARGSDLNLIGQDARARARMIDACQQAQACIGVSAALVEVLRSWGVPSTKLHVVRNGVDLDHFAPREPAEARRALGLAPQAPVLLSVGNLLELKGHHLLIEAVGLLRTEWPALQLYIAGAGPYRAVLEDQIERQGLAAQVRLLGAVPHAALVDWYAAADLLLLASSREGLPNVVLEGLASGTPVVATAVGGIPEVIERPGAAGELVKARSAQAFAEVLRRRLKQSPDRAAARALAEQFSWTRSAAQLAQLMQAAVMGA